jgi:hypothetical protein
MAPKPTVFKAESFDTKKRNINSDVGDWTEHFGI